MVGAQLLDDVAQRREQGLRVVIGPDAQADKLKDRMSEGGEGEVHIVLQLADTGQEVEVTLPSRYDVSPRIKGAIKVLGGVNAVEPLTGSPQSTHMPTLALAKS